MKIVFSMDGIKNMDQLYTWTTEYSEILGCDGEHEHYHGTDYCKRIISSLAGWKSSSYLGQRDIIGNETFSLVANDDAKYAVSFTISTYEKKTARITVTMTAPETETYDLKLEKLKITLKDKLIPDWQVCTWLVDEQAAKLCREAYEHAFIIENNLRAFASKVLIHFLGVAWIKRAGMEKWAESVKNLKDKFTQRVPEFDNINTDFLSMTLETLAAIMFTGEIYNEEVVLGRQEYAKLQEIASKGKNAEGMANYLKCQRKVYKNIWDDLFVPYIDDPENFKKVTHDFIEDRNHVAHSKVLSLSAYQVVEKEFSDLDALIQKADTKFDEEEASKELLYTWDAEQEEQETPEDERAYYRDRVAEEAGIDILDENRIEDWFDETLHENLYSEIYQHYHLDVCYEISDFVSPSEDELLFTVSCPVDEDGNLRIDVYSESVIDDDLGGDSICYLTAKKGDGEIVCKAEISIHNGNGSEGDNGLMEADEDTEYNDSELDRFREELITAIDELNPYPAEAEAIAHRSKGVDRVIADLACEQCGKFGVSIDEEFLPVGKCCYCGWENELVKCERCGELISVNLIENGFCPACFTYVEKQ